eukprot:ctg_7287.g677
MLARRPLRRWCSSLALRGGIQQAGAQHTGDHAVRAGSNNG